MYRNVHPYAVIAGLCSAILLLLVLRHGVMAIFGGVLIFLFVDMIIRSRNKID